MNEPANAIGGAPHHLISHAAHDMAGLLRQVGMRADSLRLEPLSDTARGDVEAIICKTRLAADYVASARDYLFADVFSGPRTSLSLHRCAHRVLCADERLQGRWEIDGDARVEGADVLLVMALRALADNVARHARPAAALRVRVAANGSCVVWSAGDTTATPEDFLPLMRRGPAAGLGLGLATVAKVMAWHGGGAAPDESADGFAIRLEFPRD